MTDQTELTVTRAMLEAAHRAELDYYTEKYERGASIVTTPYPVLKMIIEAALNAKE